MNSSFLAQTKVAENYNLAYKRGEVSKEFLHVVFDFYDEKTVIIIGLTDECQYTKFLMLYG